MNAEILKPVNNIVYVDKWLGHCPQCGMIEIRPVGEQLFELCLQELKEGRLTVGSRFPSERELAETHGISRVTANKVLAKLVSEGWLEIRRGLGTFVANRPSFTGSLREMDSFTDFAKSLNLQPQTRVLSFERLDSPDEELLEKLGLESSEPIYGFERSRSVGSVPVIFERRWVPKRLFPELKSEMLETSFYRLCREQFGHRLLREDHEVRSVFSPASATFPNEIPSLCLTGKGYLTDEQILWHQEVYYRGDGFVMQYQGASNQKRSSFSFQLDRHFLDQIINK